MEYTNGSLTVTDSYWSTDDSKNPAISLTGRKLNTVLTNCAIVYTTCYIPSDNVTIDSHVTVTKDSEGNLQLLVDKEEYWSISYPEDQPGQVRFLYAPPGSSYREEHTATMPTEFNDAYIQFVDYLPKKAILNVGDPVTENQPFSVDFTTEQSKVYVSNFYGDSYLLNANDVWNDIGLGFDGTFFTVTNPALFAGKKLAIQKVDCALVDAECVDGENTYSDIFIIERDAKGNLQFAERLSDNWSIVYPKDQPNKLIFRYTYTNNEGTLDYIGDYPTEFSAGYLEFGQYEPKAKELGVGQIVETGTPFSITFDEDQTVERVEITVKDFTVEKGFHLEIENGNDSWPGIYLDDSYITVTGDFVTQNGLDDYYSFAGKEFFSIKYGCAFLEYSPDGQGYWPVCIQKVGDTYQLLDMNARYWTLTHDAEQNMLTLSYHDPLNSVNREYKISCDSVRFTTATMLFREPLKKLEEAVIIQKGMGYKVELNTDVTPDTQAIAYVQSKDGNTNHVISGDDSGLSIADDTVTLIAESETPLTGAEYQTLLTNADVLEFTETPTLFSRLRTAVVSLFVDVARADAGAKQLLVYKDATGKYIAYDTRETLTQNTNGTLSSSDGKTSIRNVKNEPLSNVVLVFNEAAPQEENPPVPPVQPTPVPPSYPQFYPDHDETVTVQPAPEETAPAASEYIVACRRLNVRRTPSTRYARIGRIKRGDAIKVVEWVGKWAKIEWKGGTAYVHGNYITPVD